MKKHKIKVLIKQKDVKEKICKLAKRINKDYKDKDLTIISVLSGSFVFCSDIIRNLNIDFDLDFIRVESYKGKKSVKKIKLLTPVQIDVKGKNVLVIEDIYDTGRTLAYIKKILLKKKAKSVKVCVLINKKIQKSSDIDIDYFGFNIENKFVVGYGLDYNGRYRGLPYIGVL